MDKNHGVKYSFLELKGVTLKNRLLLDALDRIDICLKKNTVIAYENDSSFSFSIVLR